MRSDWIANRFHGLKARFSYLILRSVVIGGLLIFVFLNLIDLIVTNGQSGLEQRLIAEQARSLQSYIQKNRISKETISYISRWEHRRPVILLELYSDGECIYSSISGSQVFMVAGLDPYNYGLVSGKAITINLTDGDVLAYMYSDFSNQVYMVGAVLTVIVAVSLAVMLFLSGNRRLIDYICCLNSEVAILEGGNLEYPISIEGNDEVSDLARSMNRMRISILAQKETERKLHESSRQLVSEMSHDLRTPLTSIMLYLEILRSHRYSSETELQEYLDKIAAKAHLMKSISDHLFEYTLEGTPQRQSEPLLFEQALGSVVEDFGKDLTQRGFQVERNVQWNSRFVHVNQEYVNRIFGNIASNIVKYAEPKAPVLLEMIETEKYCGFSVMNTCLSTCDAVDSNGIGLESIRTMMNQMGGTCTVEQTDTMFEISILFPTK